MIQYIFLYFLLLVACVPIKDRLPTQPLHKQGDATRIQITTLNILSTADLQALPKKYRPWHLRRSEVLRVLRANNSDFLAVQESSQQQLEFLEISLNDTYDVIDYRAHTSDAVLFYAKDRYELIEQGYRLLEPLNRILIPRLLIWGSFRHIVTGKEMFVASLHLDAKKIKIGEAKKVARFVRDFIAQGIPVFVAGDFNIDPKEPEYPYLLVSGLINSNHIVAKEFNTFPSRNPIRRIDHILYAGEGVKSFHWQIYEEETVQHYSDHKAVVAEFYLQKLEE